jgi:hypothetical protein
MDIEQAREVIREEGLGPYAMYENVARADTIFIQRGDEGWLTYVTGERAGIAGRVSRFPTEELALDNFIKRLRAGRRRRELAAKRRAEDDAQEG